MVKEVLAQCWIYAGTRYGPGEADLSPDVHAALGAKGAFPSAVTAVTDPELPRGAQTPAADDLITTVIGAEAATALREAGYGTVAAVQAADDATLLAVPGIGPARLEKLRALPAAADAGSEE